MSQNYNEIICTAIDEIVTARIKDIQCDITKQCSIIDDSYSYEGKYIVSDGGAKFEAFSTDTSFRKGNNVLVTIPNGDFKLQKTIVGRIATTNTTPFKYTSPLSTMLKIEDKLFENQNFESVGLLINKITNPITKEHSPTAIKYIDIEIPQDNKYEGFSRLGVSVDFKCLLNSYNVISGSYGIKIYIHANVTDKPGNSSIGIWELTFDSSEMIGNPYYFDDFFPQEKVFDISGITNIEKIEVYLYQDGKFKDSEGEFIPSQYKEINFEDNTEIYKDLLNNLFVDGIKLYFGYELEKYNGETLQLYTTSQLSTYHYSREDNNGNRKIMSLRWIHQNKDSTITLLDQDDINNNNYEIHWFKYNYGYPVINKYAGANWEEITPKNDDITLKNSLTHFFDPNIKNQREQIKVVGLITNEIQDLEDEEKVKDSIIAYQSNILIFENEERVVDDLTYNASTGLSIVCEDGSEGNYFIYDQNNKIINPGLGSGYTRYFKVLYNGQPLNESPDFEIDKYDYIKWYLPFDNDNIKIQSNTHTMVIKNPELWGWENGKYKNDSNFEYLDIILRDGVDYIGIQRTATKEGNDSKYKLEDRQPYMIKNQYTQQDSNNIIRCEARIKGTIYKATEELRFGKAGSNGTNTTLVLEMVEGKNALNIAEENKEIDELQIRAILYDMDGKIIDFPQIKDSENNLYNDITWSWFSKSEKDYIKIKDENNTKGKNIITLTTDIKDIPNDNYYILKATCGGSPSLEAYLPIPLKTSNITYMEGAKEVLYDYQGKPSYYSDAYILFDKDFKEINNNSWEIINADSYIEDKTIQSYLPKLKDITRNGGKKYKALQASQFYSKDLNNGTCVSIKGKDENNNILYGWSQPILISQNNYNFALLNQWDGSLTLNENNGTILSTMLGAGRKNNQNQFSGVLIGDIQGGTELDSSDEHTGVYGLHDGELSYALRDDGTATFGKAGHGQIKIDGNSGQIYSPSYFNEKTNEDVLGTGMLIDLDDGIIDILGGAKAENPRFRLSSSEKNILIDINNNEQYLQSNNSEYDNNKKLIKGTKIDLSTGKIDIKNDDNEILIEPSSPYLSIKTENYTLINIGDEDYFLQSKFYSSHLDNNIFNDEGKEVYYYNEGLEYNNKKFYYVSLKTIDNEDKYIYNEKFINNNGIISYKVYKEENSIVPISIYIVQKTDTDYIAAVEKYKEENPNIEDNDDDIYNNIAPTVLNQRITIFKEAIEPVKGAGQGMRIDLDDGNIIGYNLYLKANNQKEPDIKYVLIDSSANNYPFVIGSKFKVDWNGALTCNKVNSLNNDNRVDQAISISNNFYVSKNGSAGGSNAKWTGNSSLSGSVQGTGSFSSLGFKGHKLDIKSKKFITKITATPTTTQVISGKVMGPITVDGHTMDYLVNGYSQYVNAITSIKIKGETETINYLGY